MTHVCRLDDIPDGDAREFEVDGEAVVAVRQGQRVRLYRNRCPHLGIELNFQPDVFLDRDGEFIQCANHGALFEIATGHCIAGPCAGDHLEALEAVVRDGEVHTIRPGS